jgi:hypothetical protein
MTRDTSDQHDVARPTVPEQYAPGIEAQPATGSTPEQAGAAPGLPHAVVEIRVHGVGGSTPENLLGDPHPTFVWGDRNAGFYRGPDREGRHVEAYSWGGITSRSSWRVLWLGLLPFALANIAGWMVSRRVEADRRKHRIHRYLVRAAGLGITLNLLILSAMIVVDLWAYQCGGQQSCARDRWSLSWLWSRSLFLDHPGKRVVVGFGLLALVLGVLSYLSFRTRVRFEDVDPVLRVGTDPRGGTTPDEHDSAAALPGGLVHPMFWDGARAQRRLGRLHVGAGFAFLAVALSLGTHRAVGSASGSEHAAALGSTVFVLGGVVLVAAFVLIGFEQHGDRIAPVVLWTGLACLLGALLHAWLQPAFVTQFGHFAGIRWATNLSYGTVFVPLGVLLVLVATDEVRAALQRRRLPVDQRSATPHLVCGSFVAIGLGAALLNGVMLGFLIWAARALGDIRWEVHSGLESTGGAGVPLAVFPVIGQAIPWLVLVPLLMLVVFALVLVLRGRRWVGLNVGAVQEEYDRLEQAAPAPEPPLDVWMRSALEPRPTSRWVKQVAWGRYVARSTTRLSVPLVLMALGGTLLVAVGQVMIWGLHTTIITFALNIGVTVAALLPLAAFALLRAGWRDPQTRRLIGILWDVNTFWPRCFHPLAPPSYAEKAVPDLQRRIWWLQDHGHPVLVAAHSQGTVLTAAAMVQADSARSPHDRVALATFGCPLVKLYAWGFPAYFHHELLGRLAPGKEARIEDWHNFYTLTDYIGGPVELPGADVDVRLPDPTSSRYVFGQPQPPLGRHSGYWTDPAMWHRIDQMAAALGADVGADIGAAVTPGVS